MPSLNRSAAASFDVELHHRQNYNTGDRLTCEQSNIPKQTLEQKGIYEQVIKVNNWDGEIFLSVDRGGTDKTFIIRLTLAAILCQNNIALDLA